jgi:hypothetical protein
MSQRFQGGILGVGFNPLQAPNAPTDVTATGGDASATVTFTAPANVGGSAITGYTGRSTPDNVAATASASPLTFSGLTNGTSYTFNVWALNTYGPSPAGGPSGAVSPSAPLGVFAGGVPSTYTNVIQYVNISTTGNALDFGDLTIAAQDIAGLGSATRGIYGGFYYGASPDINTINYITFATTGNALDFGDMIAGVRARAAFNSATRGVFAGGIDPFGNAYASIEYITIATTGNGTNFGNLSNSSRAVGCSSPVRGLAAEGYFSGSARNVIEYVTIATTGNAIDFGDLTVSRFNNAAASNNTRAIFAGGLDAGSAVLNVIDYVTIATTGNATDFGDLSALRYDMAGCASPTRALFAGAANDSYSTVAFLDYVTIATPGNSVNFGSLTTAARACGAASNANGGL